MELSEGGKVQKRYIRGNDLVFADKGENAEKTYYVTDTHGNVVQLLDETGNVTKVYEYDSFGNEVNPEKKDDNPFRYCGEYYDKETEEIYLRARYYQPSVGRFITRDTYTGEENEPLSLHLYTYCENDGVNMVDPSGHWGKKIHEKITKEVLEENGIVNRKKYDFDTIIDYCTFPDKVQSGKVKPKAFLGFSVDDGFKQGAKWHGRNRKLLDDLKKDAKRKKLNKKITKNSREKKSRLLACILHSIEDWYAHSYILGTPDYKINFQKYKPNSAEAKFHIDWIRIRENGKLKVIKDDKEDEDGNTMHTLYKDNPKKDFNLKSKKWVSCTYSKNKRIKAAKKECKQYL